MMSTLRVNPADWTTEELEVLRLFKERTPKLNSDKNQSPFDDRVARPIPHTSTNGCDLQDLHQEVRSRIMNMIAAVRDGKKKSQVLLVAGETGTGKTHLLNGLRSQEMQHENRYIFVGGSNTWQINEFGAQLLDWLIQSLTSPTPTDDQHPLLERIQAIAFRAAEQILENVNGWRTKLARGGWLVNKCGRLGRWIRWYRGPSRDSLLERVRKRDVSVFAEFDEVEFGDAVCDRFLAEPGDIQHRYVMRVLLSYLFPDRHEYGVGHRERVLHWFADRAKDSYFSQRLGASLDLDKRYSQFKVVQLLTHLFSQEVSEGLGVQAKLLLLTFDQIEGRHELFDNDQDWLDFFAYLGELYASLSNVVILFTMTLQARNRLHALMERQFQDRIIMDEKLTLHYPSQAQLLGIYQSRISEWINSDPNLKAKYDSQSNPYLPFAAENIALLAGNQSIRRAMEQLDHAFIETVGRVVVSPHLDYRYAVNEIKAERGDANEWDYTAGHIDTLCNLIQAAEELVCDIGGFRIQTHRQHLIEKTPVLSFVMIKPNTTCKIVVHVARIGWNIKAPIEKLVEKLLYNRDRNNNFLMVVRPAEFDYGAGRYADQFQRGLCDPDVDSAFQGLIRISQNAEAYRQDPFEYQEYCSLFKGELAKTYLGQFLLFIGQRLEAKFANSSGAADQNAASVPAATIPAAAAQVAVAQGGS